MDPALHAEAKSFLLAIPVFGGMSDRAMGKLLALIAVRDLPPGAVVCAEGEPGREMFVIRTGAVEVMKRQPGTEATTRLARLVAGDCFGEMSLIDVQPRSAAVVTSEPTVVYALSNADFYTLYQYDLEGYTFLVMNICRELSRRLRKTNSVVADFSLQKH